MAQRARRRRAAHTEHEISEKAYWIVFAALMVLLVLTVAASDRGPFNFDVGTFNIVIALAIAAAKAVLIILYFMHVRISTRLVWLFSFAAFYWLAIMLWFTFTDYLSRPYLPIPGK
jgi:caa(3)-type oxidase subunit IV